MEIFTGGLGKEGTKYNLEMAKLQSSLSAF